MILAREGWLPADEMVVEQWRSISQHPWKRTDEIIASAHTGLHSTGANIRCCVERATWYFPFFCRLAVETTHVTRPAVYCKFTFRPLRIRCSCCVRSSLDIQEPWPDGLEWDEPMPKLALRRWDRWLSPQLTRFAQHLDAAQLPSEILQKHAKMSDSLFRVCFNLGLRSRVLYSNGHGEITFGATRRDFNSMTWVDGSGDGSGTRTLSKERTELRRETIRVLDWL